MSNATTVIVITPTHSIEYVVKAYASTRSKTRFLLLEPTPAEYQRWWYASTTTGGPPMVVLKQHHTKGGVWQYVWADGKVRAALEGSAVGEEVVWSGRRRATINDPSEMDNTFVVIDPWERWTTA